MTRYFLYIRVHLFRFRYKLRINFIIIYMICMNIFYIFRRSLICDKVIFSSSYKIIILKNYTFIFTFLFFFFFWFYNLFFVK